MVLLCQFIFWRTFCVSRCVLFKENMSLFGFVYVLLYAKGLHDKCGCIIQFQAAAVNTLQQASFKREERKRNACTWLHADTWEKKMWSCMQTFPASHVRLSYLSSIKLNVFGSSLCCSNKTPHWMTSPWVLGNCDGWFFFFYFTTFWPKSKNCIECKACMLKRDGFSFVV